MPGLSPAKYPPNLLPTVPSSIKDPALRDFLQRIAGNIGLLKAAFLRIDNTSNVGQEVLGNVNFLTHFLSTTWTEIQGDFLFVNDDRNNMLGKTIGCNIAADGGPAAAKHYVGLNWTALGVRAFAPTTTAGASDSPDDTTEIGLYEGMPVWIEWSNMHPFGETASNPTGDPSEPQVPTAQRATTSRPNRGVAGLAVSNPYNYPYERQAVHVVSRGPVEAVDWTRITGSANLTPGALYYLASGTGNATSGMISTTRSDFPIGRAISTRVLFVDLTYRDFAIVTHSIAQTVAAATPLILAWDTSLKNPAGIWSGAANTKLTAVLAGRYKVTASVPVELSAADSCQFDLLLNGAPQAHARALVGLAAGVPGMLTCPGLCVDMNAGDYIEVTGTTLGAAVPTFGPGFFQIELVS